MTPDEAMLRIPFLCSLSEEEQQCIGQNAKLETLTRGGSAWWEGTDSQDFVFVVRGRLKLQKVKSTPLRTIIDTVEPGEIACANVVCSYAPYCCSGIALEDQTQFLRVERSQLLNILQNSPNAARNLVTSMAQHCQAVCERVDELSSGKVEVRIARLLLKLAERSGNSRADGGIRIPIALTRKEIAELCATTTETAIRTMSLFKERGVVETITHGFLVKDISSLRQIVEPK